MRNLPVLWVPIFTAASLAGCDPIVTRYVVRGDAGVVPTPPLEDPSLAPARLQGLGMSTCSTPSLRAALGPFDRRVEAGPAASTASLWSGGILAGDLDGDGLLDLLAPYEPFAKLFRGRPGGAMASWHSLLSGFDLTMGSGGSVADIDGDGDLDALVLRWDAPSVVLLNEGGGVFVDGTAASGIGATGPTTSSAWGDMDGDGDLDLFVGAYGDLGAATPAHGYLYENAGDGTFFDRSSELRALVDDGYTRVGGFHDLDDDGLPELYIVNDVGSVAPNVLLRNVHGHFERDDNQSGLDLAMSGGGLGAGDLNGDDVPDFLIPQWDEISLMLSSGGRWFDHAANRGLSPDPERGQQVGWGAELADLDNDGDLDGLVAYGAFDVDIPYWDNPEEQPDALFLQQDDGTFVDAAPDWGLDDPGKNRGFVVADFNGDGWLDVVTRDVSGPSGLYLSRCGEAHWLSVTLRDDQIANRGAVGARIKVATEDGRSWTRWITAGGTGYGSGGPPSAHFGLGDATLVTSVEVRWPDGSVSRLVQDLEVDQPILVTRE